MGTSSVASTGFLAGAASGAGGGISSGFVNGFGNKAVGGGNIGEMFTSGFRSGIVGGIIGGVLGGISGGISAMKKDLNFFTGKASFDLTQGYGAYDIPLGLDKITGNYRGQYNLDKSVAIYESSKLGEGIGSGGITLPGRGIIVGNGAFSKGLFPDLLMHEYGHILQARIIGTLNFYAKIGVPSLLSAANTFKLGSPFSSHSTFWTETWANYLASTTLGRSFINPNAFPSVNISNLKLLFLQLGKFTF